MHTFKHTAVTHRLLVHEHDLHALWLEDLVNVEAYRLDAVHPARVGQAYMRHCSHVQPTGEDKLGAQCSSELIDSETHTVVEIQ